MPLHFVNPNFHVILIHYPLGVFMLGVMLELGGFLWRRSSVRVAARWMILLGGLASLPAATSGIFALSDVATHQDMTKDREHFLRLHTILQSCASLLAVFTVVFGLAASNHMRRRAQPVLMLLLLLCAGGMVVGSWFGGETVYTQQTAVQVLRDSESPDAATPPPAKRTHKISYYTGQPVQIHMIMAGVAFAFALASLGLSIRKITSLYPEFPSTLLTGDGTVETDNGGIPLVAPHSEYAGPGTMQGAVPPDPEVVIAGRFWLLAALLAIVTAVGGYWVWASDNNQWALGASGTTSWPAAAESSSSGRAISLHVWIGLSLIVLTLILAALSQWSPRNKAVLGLFALLLVLVISAQTWLGILLQFEGSEGPLLRFSPEKQKTTYGEAGRVFVERREAGVSLTQMPDADAAA